MGTSTDAYLAFGINFDEDDLEYQLMESKTLNEQQKNIITLYLDENGGIDENLLLILFLEGGGCVENPEKNSESSSEEDEFKINLISHCAEGCNMHVLSIGEYFRASRGYPEEIAHVLPEIPLESRTMLIDFCRKLGIEYTNPTWFLFSDWR